MVWVSSGGMYAHPFTDDVAADLEYTAEEYDGTTAYARTKRMQVIVAEQLATRYAADGIAVHSMHPGWARTPGVTESLPRFARVMRPLLRSAAEGADTIVWLAASPIATETSGAVLVRSTTTADRVPPVAARDLDRPRRALGLLLRRNFRWLSSSKPRGSTGRSPE